MLNDVLSAPISSMSITVIRRAATLPRQQMSDIVTAPGLCIPGSGTLWHAYGDWLLDGLPIHINHGMSTVISQIPTGYATPLLNSIAQRTRTERYIKLDCIPVVIKK